VLSGQRLVSAADRFVVEADRFVVEAERFVVERPRCVIEFTGNDFARDRGGIFRARRLRHS
jgi:hypothetical protein